MTSESINLAFNASAGAQPAKTCAGGDYLLMSNGALSGTTNLEVLTASGLWLAVAQVVTVPGTIPVSLPPGQVRINLGAGTTGAYVTLSKVPR